MNIVRKRLVEKLKEKYEYVEETFGYITKEKRLRLGLGQFFFISD